MGSSRSFANASTAEMNLYFCKYSSANGITTSQIKVTPATKNGYLVKKSSIETNIASKLSLVEVGIVVSEEAKEVRGKERVE